MATTTTESVNPSVFSRMPFDPQKDLQPVALLANSHLFLMVRPNLPVSNLKEFVEYAKANPNTLRFGSAGNGTTPHLTGELFKQAGKLKLLGLASRNRSSSAPEVPTFSEAPIIKARHISAE